MTANRRPMLWIAHVPDGHAERAVFAIDERDYPDRDAAEVVLRQARREMRRRGKGVSWEATQVPEKGSRYPLPTWQQYRAALEDHDNAPGRGSVEDGS